MAKEILDIVDDNGQPTGEVIDRVTAHRGGILHRTSHVWLVRMKDTLRLNRYSTSIWRKTNGSNY